jgi:hypothetical protein
MSEIVGDFYEGRIDKKEPLKKNKKWKSNIESLVRNHSIFQTHMKK